MVLQLGYAAVTSRVVGAETFGAYSVAVLVANLVSILSAAGLGQSVARSLTDPEKTVRGLATVALGYGLIAALIITPLAPMWAALWGNPAATSSIQLVGLSAAVAPSVGLLSGYLRRQRRFSELAVGTTVSTAAALLVSGVLVSIFRTPEALIAAPALTQIFSYIAFQLAVRGAVLPGSVGHNTMEHLSFGWRVSVANLMAYGIENIGRFAVSRAVGQVGLGLWNRADVITTVPFDRLQGAMIQALYPELAKGHEEKARTRRVWTDTLIIVGWISVPASLFLAGAVPSLVPILLGPDWTPVVTICVILAVAAGFRGTSIQLASALEAAGYFRWIWATHAVLLGLQIVCALLVFVSMSPVPAIVGMLVIPIARHTLQVRLCSKAEILDAAHLAVNYSQVLIAALLCGTISASASALAISRDANVFVCAMLLAAAIAIIALIAYLLRRKLPIFKLASQYGFLK